MNAIEIREFSKSYKTNRAVDHLDLQVPCGSFFGFVGPNGAGKSTVVHFIAGLLRPDRGELELFGDRITPEQTGYKQRLGFVLEKPFYVERLTAREYLCFVGRMYRLETAVIEKRSDELLRLFELEKDQHKWIETHSTGMKKKISLAAALIHDPDLLVLDEPFDGVDAVAAVRIRENLQRLVKRGKTVFLTSNHLDLVARLCDRVAIINRGKLIVCTEMATLERQLQRDDHSSDLDFERYFLSLVETPAHSIPLSWNTP